MKTESVLAIGVVTAGGIYLLTRPSVQQEIANAVPALSALGVPTTIGGLSPAQRTALQLIPANPGNAPVVAGASFNGAAVLDSAAIGAVGLLAHAGVFGAAGGLAAGAVTLGIGLAVTFFTYEWMKQQASIATNRKRDAWTKQFIALHDALGLTPLTAAQTTGSGPGDLEMAEVVFYFDHDSSQRLWHAVQSTQNESQFANAARAVDTFLSARGVPVTGP